MRRWKELLTLALSLLAASAGAAAGYSAAALGGSILIGLMLALGGFIAAILLLRTLSLIRQGWPLLILILAVVALALATGGVR